MPRALFDTPDRPVLDLELATTPEEQRRGLANRRALPRSRGMLFIHENPIRASVWMKDTYFPLDVFFIDGMRVVDLAERLQPLSESVIVSAKPAQFMLEAHGGFAALHGVTRGTRVLLSF